MAPPLRSTHRYGGRILHEGYDISVGAKILWFVVIPVLSVVAWITWPTPMENVMNARRRYVRNCSEHQPLDKCKEYSVSLIPTPEEP